jgi:hypothetical protein
MSSKKKALTLLTLTLLIASTINGLLLTETVKANPVSLLPFEHAPVININGDGSITPDTGLISQNGNTYTLTANITNYQVLIKRNNIVFDGAGHSINVTSYNVYDENGKINYTANFESDGISLIGYPITNVTVKNIEIISSVRAIYTFNCFDCYIANVVTNQRTIELHESNNNTITNCSIRVSIASGSRNIFFKNNISAIFVGSSENIFYLNNIFDAAPDISGNNFWDNASVGNYWSDYAARYPNASEVNQTGVGDIPYVIDGSNIDNHPLMNLIDFETTQPTRDIVSEQSLMAYAAVIALSIAAVATVLIYCQRKRKAKHV